MAAGKPCKVCVARWREAAGLPADAKLPVPLPPELRRPAPHPGPRCATDHRAKVKADKARAHEAHVARVFDLKPGEYEELLAFQGGRCFICQWAKGISKKLPVDHDHATGEVRGLLCTNCNRWVVVLGREGLLRAIDYLRNPPAARWRMGRD